MCRAAWPDAVIVYIACLRVWFRSKLVEMCHKSLREKKSAELLKALQGHYTQQGLFALNQAFQAYTFYQGQIFDCDKQIQNTLEKISADKSLPEGING